MKLFIFCIVLFLLLTTAIILNMHYIHSIIDKLTYLTESLPESIWEYQSSGEKYKKPIEEIYTLWDKKINYISYSIDYNRIDSVDLAISEIYVSFSTEDFNQLLLSRQRLLDSLKRIRSLESISWLGIF